MGNEYLDSKMRIAVTDTSTMVAYTFLEDSFATSGRNVVCVGYYEDPILGKYTASSYISFKTPTEDVNQNDILDHVTLKMYYTGDYYGDTTQNSVFRVYYLNNLIELNSKTNLLYNINSVSFGTKLAEHTFKPQPNVPAIKNVPNSKFIEVTLTSSELDTLFETLKKSDLKNIDFRKLFNGLALIPNTNTSSSVCSFKFSDTLTSLNFYYHDYTVDTVLKVLKISSEPIYQFNRIDQSEKLYAELTNNKNKIRSDADATKNKFYIQASRGMSGIIEFPGLSNLLLIKQATNVKIAQADLYLNVVKGSFGNDVLLPDSLNIDVVNNIDEVSSYTAAVLIKDDVFNKATYKADITFFLNEQLTNSISVSTRKRLKIVVPESNNRKYLRRVIVGDQYNDAPYKLKTTIKLMLYVDK